MPRNGDHPIRADKQAKAGFRLAQDQGIKALQKDLSIIYPWPHIQSPDHQSYKNSKFWFRTTL